ncbi:MAG: hypothetical protein Fur0018_14450 [Anaerolineales bacterium]
MLLLLGVLSASPGRANVLTRSAQDGGDIFTQKCAACHTIGGGKLVGPDLQGVTQRRSLDWLRAFILNPQGMVDKGDADAVALVQEYNGLVMPAGLVSDEEVDAILAFLESVSQTKSEAPSAENTDSAAQPVPVVDFPLGRRAMGEMLFRGEERFANGGLPCNACHGAFGAGVGLTGTQNASLGSLGPDLTHLYGRMGEVGLQAALKTLPFPVMQPTYANAPLTAQEQADLLAYFAYLDANAQAAPAVSLFWGAGIALTLVLFALLSPGWQRQRTSISETLRSQA